MKSQKRIIAVLFCICMLQLFFLEGKSASAAMTVTEPLDFVAVSENVTTEGYRWEAATHTLHLDGLCINLSSKPANTDAIRVPADATIISEEGTYNCVIQCRRFAIVSDDMVDRNATLTIKGSGALDFLYCSAAIGSYNNLMLDGVTINGVSMDDFIYMRQGKMERNHQVTVKNSTIRLYNSNGGIYTMGQYATDPKNNSKPFYETNVLIDHSDLDFQIGVDYFNTQNRYYGFSIMNGRLSIKQSKVNIDSIQPAVVVWRQYNANDPTTALIGIDESGTDYFIADGQEIQAKEKMILGSKFRMETVVVPGEKFDFDFKRNGKDADETLSLAYGHKITGASDRFTINEYSDAMIHFNSNGGNAIEDMNYKTLHKQGALPVPAKDGCDFIGWSIDGTKDKICIYENVVKWQDELILHAVWQAHAIASVQAVQATPVPAQSTANLPQQSAAPVQAVSGSDKATGLKQISVKSNQITVRYNKITGANSYRLYAYDTQAKKYVKQSEVKKDCNQITIKKIKNSKGKSQAIKPGCKIKLQLRVTKRINGKVKECQNSTLYVYTCPAKTNIKVTRKKNQIKISWKKNKEATGYVLRLRLKGAKKDAKKVTLKASKMSYSYKVMKNKVYDIYLRAYKKQGEKKVFSQTAHVRK